MAGKLTMTKDELEDFIDDDDTTIECIQVAPMGGGKVAILYLLSNSDYDPTVSVIFVVDDFNPKTAKGVLVTSEWLTSLSASPSGELFALEATVWVWRYAGSEWTRDRVGDVSFRQVWAAGPSGPMMAGSEGVAVRLVGTDWQRITPINDVEYMDLHGDASNGIWVCGDSGSVHKLAGSTWQALELHRQDHFYGIDVAGDGTIRVAGGDGVCLRIANEEVIEIEPADSTTHLAVRTFKGKAYWGDEGGLGVEEGDKIALLDVDIGTASDLRTDGEFLYVAGVDAWRFDGKTWKSLALEYRNGFRLV
jgi:hypothetical protein